MNEKHDWGISTLTDEDLMNSDTITKKTYIAHRLEGVHLLKFMQFWKEEKDEVGDAIKEEGYPL